VPRRKASLLSSLEEQVFKRLIKFAKTTNAEATAANLRNVRKKLRAQPVKRADDARFYAIATALPNWPACKATATGPREF
jgi:hypothetical protein